jgi:hypothetical protein
MRNSYRSAGVVAFAAAGFVVAPAFDADAFDAAAPVPLAAPGFDVALEGVAPVAFAAPDLEVALGAAAPVDLATPGLEVADALDTVPVLK